jgi:hypothetical protein
MQSTTIRIERPEGTVIATGLAAAYENAAVLPGHDEGEHRDYAVVALYVLGVPAVGVRRRDVAQDERNLDPLTGQPVRLRVTAVEIFDNDHIECLCEQLIGV